MNGNIPTTPGGPMPEFQRDAGPSAATPNAAFQREREGLLGVQAQFKQANDRVTNMSDTIAVIEGRYMDLMEMVNRLDCEIKDLHEHIEERTRRVSDMLGNLRTDPRLQGPGPQVSHGHGGGFPPRVY